MTRAAIACCLVAAGVAGGQTAPPRHPEFESENVRLNKSGAAARAEQFDGRQFTMQNSTIAELLPFAFLRKESAIAGIPSWFRSDRYDIVAKAPSDSTERTLALMLQSLLAREFGLAFHEETRDLDTFAVTVAEGGSRLRKVPGPGYPACVRGDATEQLEADCASITIKNLMTYLSNVAQDYTDRPLVDQTGMTGTYELKLTWTPRRLIDRDGGLTLFEALTKQAGLRLEPRRLPVSVIVIDRAERLAGN